LKDHFERQRGTDGSAPQWQGAQVLLRRYMLNMLGLRPVPQDIWSVPRIKAIPTSEAVVTPTSSNADPLDDTDEDEFQ
jgi:hypothetical protein